MTAQRELLILRPLTAQSALAPHWHMQSPLSLPLVGRVAREARRVGVGVCRAAPSVVIPGLDPGTQPSADLYLRIARYPRVQLGGPGHDDA